MAGCYLRATGLYLIGHRAPSRSVCCQTLCSCRRRWPRNQDHHDRRAYQLGCRGPVTTARLCRMVAVWNRLEQVSMNTVGGMLEHT